MDKEQIKKLAMQAGEYTNEVYVPPVRSKTPGKIWEGGHVGWHDIFNEKFAELVAAHVREACAKKAAEFAQKWWSIHCDSNKHMETTRKAHDDFCALQSAIRARK